MSKSNETISMLKALYKMGLNRNKEGDILERHWKTTKQTAVSASEIFWNVKVKPKVDKFFREKNK